jgi:hypothetical protein
MEFDSLTRTNKRIEIEKGCLEEKRKRFVGRGEGGATSVVGNWKRCSLVKY